MLVVGGISRPGVIPRMRLWAGGLLRVCGNRFLQNRCGYEVCEPRGSKVRTRRGSSSLGA